MFVYVSHKYMDVYVYIFFKYTHIQIHIFKYGGFYSCITYTHFVLRIYIIFFFSSLIQKQE